PITTMISHADGDFQKFNFTMSTPLSKSGKDVGCFACGIHTPIATNVSTIQIPSEPCQSNILIFDNSTLTPEASAPKIFIHTAYNPVSKPILKGNVSLINPGSNTLPKEIATPISAVPINNVITPVTERRQI